MKLHVLKIKKEYFFYVHCEDKNFELRKDDRKYECSDLIHFVDEDGQEFPAHTDEIYRIKYILRNKPQYGLQEGYCILGIERLKGASDVGYD
mgnify:CR=1 FL=1